MKCAAIGLWLALSFPILGVTQVVGQAQLIAPIMRSQIEGSGALRERGSGVGALPVSSDAMRLPVKAPGEYNWGAGWIGMGIGAAVGAGFGALAPELSGEGDGVDPGYVLGGALIFGIFGFVIGLAVGNS
jgi:hypothetical protein